jgi:hypothetical protein
MNTPITWPVSVSPYRSFIVLNSSDSNSNKLYVPMCDIVPDPPYGSSVPAGAMTSFSWSGSNSSSYRLSYDYATGSVTNMPVSMIGTQYFVPSFNGGDIKTFRLNMENDV